MTSSEKKIQIERGNDASGFSKVYANVLQTNYKAKGPDVRDVPEVSSSIQRLLFDIL